jgi:hypothetical protein
MPAVRSLLALASRRQVLFLVSLSLGCVNLTPPWELAAQSGGGSGGWPGGGVGGRIGFSGSGGSQWQTTNPAGALGGAHGGSESRDAYGINGDFSPRADSGAVIGTGGNVMADAATDYDTSSAGVGSNSDGQALPTGGEVGAIGAGGKGGTVSPTGGAGGTFAQADANRGSGGSGNDASAFSKCAGVVDSSICWRLGALGASCADTCAASGGPSPNAAKHVGTAAQGGSLAECQRLFGLLGITNSVFQVSVDQGLGCHQKKSMPLPYAWASSPDYSDNACSADVSILCGCLR